VRSGLYAGGVDPAQDVEVVDDGRQLLLKLLDVGLRQAHAGKPGDVKYLFTGECHELILEGQPDTGERKGLPRESRRETKAI
jgi:hypothetical protein